jgi:CRISPR/Cas system CMR-associated protein Cmr1 (group 7 of RAMP superfamily)
MDNVFLRSTVFQVRKAVVVAVYVMTSLFGREERTFRGEMRRKFTLRSASLQGCLG